MMRSDVVQIVQGLRMGDCQRCLPEQERYTEVHAELKVHRSNSTTDLLCALNGSR
ncbi:hypothetical protein D3C76_140190 [compost metagenome]